MDKELVDDMVVAMLNGAGYFDLTIEPPTRERGDFAATAYKTNAGRRIAASALGRTPTIAARALVKVVTRE